MSIESIEPKPNLKTLRNCPEVVILGASQLEDRYSYKALERLSFYDVKIYPIHPLLENILNYPCFKSLSEIPDELHTITFYVRAEISSKLQDLILSKKFKRAIFNPGTENPELKNALKNQGCLVIEGCTLVMLSTGQF